MDQMINGTMHRAPAVHALKTTFVTQSTQTRDQDLIEET